MSAEAYNRRFGGQYSCILTDCGDGTLALFSWGGSGKLLYQGDNIHQMFQAFLTRPVYVPPAKKPSLFDDLEIDL